MEEKRKPYVTISFRQPRHSFATLVILLSIGVIAATFGIQEIQRWQKQMRATEARLHETETVLTETEDRLQETETSFAETETKLQETEAELLDAKRQLESYLPISPLNEPIAFLSTKWGVHALTCIRMPQGYWTSWGTDDAVGRLLFYSAREWDTVDAINESGQYTLVGKDEWSVYWDEGAESSDYYIRADVQELNPLTWSKLKSWSRNLDRWEGRLTAYCREALQP
ncbi:MAG: hypothetical protein OXG78_10000 [Chloroflexi bacterium]|nr:hypothetical protein [Chloroflexota bacterium]